MTVCARTTISKERKKERKLLSSTLGRRGIDLEIQSPLAIVNEKNRARSVHYSQLFSIAKMTKEVLVVRGTSKKKMVRASGATANIIETAGFKQSYVTHKS